MTDKKHIHYDNIFEWAADPVWPWQYKNRQSVKWLKCTEEPGWQPDVDYRRKPRWYDMEQEWLAKGKPPVEFQTDNGWVISTDDPKWYENIEYRFKEVSRHAALKAEWEARGRPTRQVSKDGIAWENGALLWDEDLHYRIKPIPHPDADVLRALAEDKSIIIDVLWGSGWQSFDTSNTRFKIKPQEETK